MGVVQNLSVRVPWHDSGWSGTVCADPKGNHACVMLEGIGKRRDEDFEQAHRGAVWTALDGRLPRCAQERGAFMNTRPTR